MGYQTGLLEKTGDWSQSNFPCAHPILVTNIILNLARFYYRSAAWTVRRHVSNTCTLTDRISDVICFNYRASINVYYESLWAEELLSPRVLMSGLSIRADGHSMRFYDRRIKTFQSTGYIQSTGHINICITVLMQAVKYHQVKKSWLLG